LSQTLIKGDSIRLVAHWMPRV